MGNQMIYALAGLLILLIPLFLLFPIISKLLQYFFWILTTSVDSKSGHIHHQQLDIHYLVYEDHSTKHNPIVLLHGGLSNKLSWFSQIPMLVKSGYQVILIDTRGHGKSGPGANEHCYELYANDVVNIMDKLHIDVADIIGWSDGGNTALTMGYRYPERVKRIIAISANIHPEGLTEHARNENEKPNSWLKQKSNRFWTGAAHNYPVLEQKIKKLWSTAPIMTPQMLQIINHPVLLLQGENDCVTLEHAKSMEKSLPNAQLKVIAGAGHSTPVTHAKEINSLITHFLKTD